MFFHCYKKRILCLICIIYIIVIFHYFLSWNLSTLSSLNIVSHINHSQLIDERLASYNQRYPDSFLICNKTGKPLNERKKRSMEKISELLQTYKKQILPYPIDYFHGRGIVLTTGSKQLKFARVNLKMLELSGTKLPVEIWYSSSQVPIKFMIKLLHFVPKLHARVCCFLANECRTIHNVYPLNSTYVYQPRQGHLRKVFPYKPASILSSTFAEVLFLDCDAYVTRDPEPLFLSDPMYLRFGALFYPDAIKSRQHPIVWNLFNTSCGENEYEFDSAVILVDKRRVWNGLYLTKLMNDDYIPFYRTGSYNGSHFCGHTLCKTDSLAQHIYINHAHLFKYDAIQYSSENLAYTRIGLGDPNNNSFLFQHCSLGIERITCFFIFQEQNEKLSSNHCHYNSIPLNEIKDRSNILNEPLLSDITQTNQILMSKTDDLMPFFIDNFLEIVKKEF